MISNNTQYFQELYSRNKSQLLGNDLSWFKDLRERAMTHFVEHGLPTRHDEDWKYTSVSSLEKHEFLYNNFATEPAQKMQDLDVNDGLVLCQGKVLGLEKIKSQLPKEAIVTDLITASQQYPQLLKQYLSTSVNYVEPGFIALNTALMQNGIFVFIPKQVQVLQPVILQYVNSDNQIQCWRNIIVVEQAAQLTISEIFRGSNKQVYFTNTVSEVFLADQASVTHTKLQYESDQSFHVGKLYVTQNQASHFESNSFSFGGLLVRSDTQVKFANEAADCVLNGLYIAGNKQHIDHHTCIQHAQPANKSQEYYKGILRDEARAVFNGKVIVDKNAQHTDSSQYNKNLLLSRNAQVNTKPQLEIYADDVKCSHGATVGQLDEEAIFYLRSRGINQPEAEQLLIQAFADDILVNLQDHALKQQIKQNILTYLG